MARDFGCPPPSRRRNQWAERPGTFRGIKRKQKPLGWRAMAPCVTSPYPETDLPEAKQLRLCLLSKSGLKYTEVKSLAPKTRIHLGELDSCCRVRAHPLGLGGCYREKQQRRLSR